MFRADARPKIASHAQGRMRDDIHTSPRLGVVWNQIEEQFALSDNDAHAVAQVVRQVAVCGLGHVLGSWVGTQGKPPFLHRQATQFGLERRPWS